MSVSATWYLSQQPLKVLGHIPAQSSCAHVFCSVCHIMSNSNHNSHRSQQYAAHTSGRVKNIWWLWFRLTRSLLRCYSVHCYVVYLPATSMRCTAWGSANPSKTGTAWVTFKTHNRQQSSHCSILYQSSVSCCGISCIVVVNLV